MLHGRADFTCARACPRTIPHGQTGHLHGRAWPRTIPCVATHNPVRAHARSRTAKLVTCTAVRVVGVPVRLPQNLAMRPILVQSTPDSLLSLHSRPKT
ncbi:unnamed protein product [Linum trigynum]|uniref:Uncharacterized protein n=1 Tax=Linum trigynum TaxID=586398 RepID=A0AAV2GWE2_9ROSI